MPRPFAFGQTRFITERDLGHAKRCLRSWIISYRSEADDPGAGIPQTQAERSRSVCDLSQLHAAEQRTTLLEHAKTVLVEQFRFERILHGVSVSVDGFAVSPDILGVDLSGAHTLFHLVPAFAPKAHSLDYARLQTVVLRRSGYDVRQIVFLCLDKEYDLAGRNTVDAQELFREVRAPKTFERSLGETETFMAQLHAGVSSANLPGRCRRQLSCETCYPHHAEKRPEHHIRTLFRGGALVDELEKQGFTDLRELSDEQLPGRRHKLQLQAIRTGVPHVDHARLRAFLEELSFPRVYLDFETISRAIPPVSGVKPWEHIPVQFSAHRQESPGADLVEFGYVADAMTPNRDERCALAAALTPVIEGAGSIIAYAAAFERRTLLRLADWCPEFSPQVPGVTEGIRDLQKPFSEFWYYDPRQYGKTGLKKVLPVMSGSGYEDLDVQDGLEASLRWQYEYATGLFTRHEEADFSSEVDRRELGSRLRDYCAQDTRGLVDIVAAIEEVVSSD
ncbi:MAG: DUF2779 domain-containing protein [Spirochaetaceae bacterium]|nr:MAG: DUF2779 domain-containing protein [Spirochaetaceae bacterium]